MDSSLTPFFRPLGVVVIGASSSPEKLGYGVARNLIASEYRGAIHFVSQKSGELFERSLYTTLSDVPDPVDLAILIVPPNATPSAIETCGLRGIQAATIVTGGFREVGAEGAALEQRCIEVARKYGIRLLGPNCIGTLDTHLPLDTTFLQPPMPAQGGISFISHSGAFAAAIIDWAREQGFGFSQIISLGNQADVNETDVLPEVAKDEHTRVIVLYLESVSNGKKFVRAASEVTKHKPVIALKVGRFESGQKAAASHTGALAGSEAAFDQLFDWARALEDCPLPRGRGMAILTNAGGPGVIAADSLEMNGLFLSQLTESTLKELTTYLPSSASAHNPVDMLASASPEAYEICLNFLLQDKNVDGVLVILPPPPMFKTEDVAEKIIGVIGNFDKPVVIALMGSTLVEEARKTFQRSQIPTYPFPERAASALGALAKRAEFVAAEAQSHGELKNPSHGDSAVDLLSEELVTTYGIQTTPIKLARNENEAIAIANELGFPVVMKIASPDILHKSDIGGVLLNIKTEKEVQNGYALLMERANKSMPNAKIEGAHVQCQIPEGQEVIIGAVRDPSFGPLIMFGSGGIEVEGLKDVAFALAPLNQAEAREMIRKTWAGRKLKGFRSINPVDEEAVIDALIKLSLLAYEHPEVAEIEINPLRVLQKGAVAVDVRMKIIGE
ncbi:MAG: acetate--CoA ligase family protein [Chloroflexi bacterium]|nr:acetate--CoA ligase family protein [Chloroflexota bacterium]